MDVQKKPILNYIAYFRAIAIILIVAGHTLCWGKSDSILYNTNCYLFKACTILFVFIAGFLFQYLSYNFEYKKYLITKLKNVIMPYWITMLPVAILFAFSPLADGEHSYHFLSGYNPFIKLFNVLLFGDIINVALWFIPMIAIFFITAPLLLKLKKYPVILYSLLICSFVFSIMKVKYTTSVAPNPDLNLLQWNFQFIYNYLYRFYYFFPSYILGMLSCEFIENHYDFINKHIKKIFLISLISWIYFYILFVHILHKTKLFSMGKYALVFLILSILIILEKKIMKRTLLHKILNLIADYSFGIFFIHLYIHYYIQSHYPYRGMPVLNGYNVVNHNSLKALLYSFTEFIIVFVGSILILYVINLILIKLGIKNTRMFTGVGTKINK